jgi:hypothetical protein
MRKSKLQGVFILSITSGNVSFFNGRHGHVKQVMSLNLSIRPSNGNSIVSISSMMSILVHVHEMKTL